MTRRTGLGAALVAALTVMVWSFALLRPAAVAAADSRAGADRFPNVELTTQDGDVVHFHDVIKGRIVAIDLIYTNCQYACPLETARLARMQQLLGDRMGRDVFFISISIDPEHDSPAVLKAYAAKYHAGPGWIFLTGKMDDIDRLSRKLGLWSDPTLTQDGHTPMLLVGNEATGQWTQTSALDNPAFTARIIGTWLNSWQTAKPGRSYAEATPIKSRDDGQYLFSSLCASCHSIGRGVRIGPDLSAALDTRDRAWLTRYIVGPDVLRAQGDPIAQALLTKYPQVRMPNLGLSASEAASILGFIAASAGPERAGLRAGGAVTGLERAGGRASATSPPPPPIVEAAIAIQVALAHDSVDNVPAQAAAIRNAAAALGPDAATIERAAGDLAAQTTIADVRRAFGVMSDALIAYLKTSHAAPGDGVRIAYCPMVRKSWLQKDGAVANPYYGRSMLACGELIASD